MQVASNDELFIGSRCVQYRGAVAELICFLQVLSLVYWCLQVSG
jgi:hypothetical protein